MSVLALTDQTPTQICHHLENWIFHEILKHNLNIYGERRIFNAFFFYKVKLDWFLGGHYTSIGS